MHEDVAQLRAEGRAASGAVHAQPLGADPEPVPPGSLVVRLGEGEGLLAAKRGVLLVGYDVEVPIEGDDTTDRFLTLVAALHRELDVPATFFVTG